MNFVPTEELREFPCTFNLCIPSPNPLRRFQYAEKILKEELSRENLDTAERVRNLNLLSWVMYSLGNKTEAYEYNKQARRNSEKNLTAMGNKIFIAFERGYKIKAERLFETLKLLQQQESFERIKMVAQAEQAYSYIKLNVIQCYNVCKDILCKCTEHFPDNYLWKLDLGFLYVRLLHYNVQFTCNEASNGNDLLSESVSLLMEVGDNGGRWLKGLAYSELVVLRNTNCQPEMDEMFRGLSLRRLCHLAERYGEDNHAVLCQCGKSLKKMDTDRAIDLLKRSIKLRKSSKAYEHLGLCFVRKADHIAGSDIDRTSAPNARNDYQRNNNRKLKLYVKQYLTPLSEEDENVQKAMKYFKKSFEYSFEENMSSRLNLGQLYFKVGRFEDALAEVNQIIDRSDTCSNYLITLISAHDLAGKCLLELNNCSQSPQNLNKAKEHFVKIICLAAGLARKDPAYKNCTTEVWDAFKKLLKDIEEIQSPKEKNKQRLQLLDMVEYTDVFREIENILRTGLDITDIQNLQIILNRCLSDGQYEKALAYLNMAMTNDTLRQEISVNSELLTMQSNIYIRTSWSRLLKGSNDVTTLFQKMFEQKYGLRAENQVGNEVLELDANKKIKKDLLIVYCEHVVEGSTGPIGVYTFTDKLFQITESVYGLETSQNFVRTTETGVVNVEDLRLQKLVNYRVILVILDDSDPESFNETIRSVHSIDGPTVLTINCRHRRQSCPSTPEGCKQIKLTEACWSQTKLLQPSLEVDGQQKEVRELSSRDVIKEIVNGDIVLVMRLFCFIVGEEFEYHRKLFQPQI